MPLVFEWDAAKAKVNQRKHRVSFDEASTVFDDPLAMIFADEDHSKWRTARDHRGLLDSGPTTIGELHGTGKRSAPNHQREEGDTERAKGL